MQINEFMESLLKAASAAGLESAEAFGVTGSNFRARATDGSLDNYQVSTSAGVGLRATLHGKMGYAGSQAFDEAAVRQMVEGVIESAELNEAEDQDEIYPGDEKYADLNKPESDLQTIPAAQKIDACMALDQKAREADERITKVQGCAVSTSASSMTLMNSYGLRLHWED